MVIILVHDHTHSSNGECLLKVSNAQGRLIVILVHSYCVCVHEYISFIDGSDHVCTLDAHHHVHMQAPPLTDHGANSVNSTVHILTASIRFFLLFMLQLNLERGQQSSKIFMISFNTSPESICFI